MIFDKVGSTVTVVQENTTLMVFVQNLKKAYPNLCNDNLIVNLFSFDGLSPDDMLEFLQLSKDHRASGKSFVLVTDKVSYDDVPEDICLAPTLQEARDIIELEEIERDLGL